MSARFLPSSSGGKGLWFLMLAGFVSGMGSGISSFALSWWIYQTTGSALKMGIVYGITCGTLLIAGPLVGKVVDRSPSKKGILLVTDLLSALVVATVGSLILAEAASLWVFYLLTAVQTMLMIPSLGARRVLVKDLSKASRIEQSAAIMIVCARAPYLVGPALGGLLIALYGPGVTLFIDAATFLAAPLIRIAVVEKPHTFVQLKILPSSPKKTEWQEALSQLYRRKCLFGLLMLVIAFQLFNGGLSAVFIVFVSDVLQRDAATYGALTSTISGFMMVTALLIAIWSLPRQLHRIALFASSLAMGIAFFLTGSTGLLAITLLMCSTIGVTDAILNAILEGRLMGEIPREQLGKISALTQILTSTSQPLSILVVSLLLRPLGPSLLIQISGVASCCIALCYLFVPDLGLSPFAPVSMRALRVSRSEERPGD